MGAPLYLSFPRRWRQGEMDRLECYWCRAFQPKSVHPSLSEPQPPTPTFTYLPRDDRCWMNWSENACMAFLYGKDAEYWYTTSAIDCFADARRINESRKWRGCLPVSAAKGRNEIFIILFFFFVLLYAGHQTASNGSFQSQGIFFFYSMGFDGTEIKERCESFGMMGMTCWLGKCLPSNAIAVGVSNRWFFRLAHHSLAVKRLWLLDSLL